MSDSPTHRCKVCGALWRLGDIPPMGVSWSLRSSGCGKCCDNVAMGDQIEPLVGEVKPAKCSDSTHNHPPDVWCWDAKVKP